MIKYRTKQRGNFFFDNEQQTTGN